MSNPSLRCNVLDCLNNDGYRCVLSGVEINNDTTCAMYEQDRVPEEINPRHKFVAARMIQEMSKGRNE